MFETISMAKAASSRRPAVILRTASITGLIAVSLLAGCAQRDSVVVGAIPDDYRTNHPIVIAEKDQSIDLPVGASERGMTRIQRVALGGFLADYDRNAAPLLTILVPVGSQNQAAAAEAGRHFAKFAKAQGVPAGRIMMSSYQAGSAEVSAPVRVMYAAMQAQTNKCGRWTADLADTTENKHYTNFGCSYQNNLAQQMDNPADLLGPRKMTEVDAERRGRVIDGYRDGPIWADEAEREVGNDVSF
jgi:pilus assembly protein CpaD